MSGSSNAGAAHRARRSLSSACGWTGVDAEVAYALESDDETFSCDQDVGNDSDEDAGESPDPSSQVSTSLRQLDSFEFQLRGITC